MFTVIAWQENQDEAAVECNEAACIDPHIAQSGDYNYVPDFASLLMAEYVYGGTTATAFRLSSPSLRAKVLQQILPIDLSITAGKEALLIDHFDNPITLVAGEGLEALLTADPA